MFTMNLLGFFKKIRSIIYQKEIFSEKACILTRKMIERLDGVYRLDLCSSSNQ